VVDFVLKWKKGAAGARRARQYPSAKEVRIDLLQNKRSREVREECRIKRERIEEKVGAQDHHGRRIRAEKPTGLADL
jgi:hypothetical protein